MGPYNKGIQSTQDDINKLVKRIEATIGIKESDTGLAPPSQWDLVQDKQMMQEEQPLQVARCTKIIGANTDEAKYVINVRQIAKFVVGLGDRVAPTDIEEGMRVGVDRNKYQIQIPLPPKVRSTGRSARQATPLALALACAPRLLLTAAPPLCLCRPALRCVPPAVPRPPVRLRSTRP